MKLEIPFSGGAYKFDSGMISSQECINLFPRPYKENWRGDTLYAMVGIPGMSLFCETKIITEVRGQICPPDSLLMYAVVGNKFISVAANGIYTALGLLITDTGRVSLSTNGNDITLVDGTTGYVYDLGAGTFSQIADPDFPGGNNIVFTDGYYLVNRPGTGQIWRSAFNDGSNWSSLAFSTAGFKPDNVLGLDTDGGDIWVFESGTVSIWYNTGVGDFNFSPIPNSNFEYGIVSSHAHCSTNNAIYWVSRNDEGQGQIFQAVGRSPKVISTQPIEKHISTMDLSSSFMFSYQQDGHNFVVLTIPNEDETWVYDSSVGEWHQRSSRVNGVDRRWRASSYCFFGRKHVVGDYSNGKLYELDHDVYDEAGEEIICKRTSPVIRSKQNRITVDEFILLTEPGVGIIAEEAEDIDPQALVSWSRDGGYTWSPEIDVALGKIGEYDVLPRVNQLGQGRNWVFSLRISAAVNRTIVGAYINATEDD